MNEPTDTTINESRGRHGVCPACGKTMLARNLHHHARTIHGAPLLELPAIHSVAAPPLPRLPVEPILRHLHLMGGQRIGTCLATAGYHAGTNARERLDKALERAITEGDLTMTAADAICCRVLRLHPCLVYGDTWWTTTTVDEPDELEVAS